MRATYRSAAPRGLSARIPFRFDDQDSVELRSLGIRHRDCFRNVCRPDHDACAFADGFIAHKIFDGNRLLVRDLSGPGRDTTCPDGFRRCNSGRELGKYSGGDGQDLRGCAVVRRQCAHFAITFEKREVSRRCLATLCCTYLSFAIVRVEACVEAAHVALLGLHFVFVSLGWDVPRSFPRGNDCAPWPGPCRKVPNALHIENGRDRCFPLSSLLSSQGKGKIVCPPTVLIPLCGLLHSFLVLLSPRGMRTGTDGSPV